MNERTAALLAWYDTHARVLPWRGTQVPYEVWVSEIMLQQTRVETVLSYYPRFLARFPDLAVLASASEAEVLKEWEGLGYYSRARNLWLGAQQVLRDFAGVLPADPEQLRKIRGIGAYTAGAIASIAFQLPVPAVDGNVIRVLSRLEGIRGDATLPKNRQAIEALAAELVPPKRPGDHNQALMDLGATVCVPGTPDCRRCPLTAFCSACRQGDAAELPVLPRAKAPRVIHYALLLIHAGSSVLLRQRTEKLLQGLWCFPLLETEPSVPLSPEAAGRALRLPLDRLQPAGAARHVFTHQVWQMTLYTASVPPDSRPPAGYAWIAPDRLKQLPFPAAMNAALDLLREP